MLDHPLRLAVGSHKAGSGQGCAMNVISWQSGDSTITDLPGCADPFLARGVQLVNDDHCTHRGDRDLLCPPCSTEVLALAQRTVGTALPCSEDLRRVYVAIAVTEAERVAHLGGPAAVECCAVVRRWLDGTATASEVQDAAYTAYTAYAAAYTTANAASAAAAAAAADRLAHAHRIIDHFEALTGVRAEPVAPEVTQAAIAAMTRF